MKKKKNIHDSKRKNVQKIKEKTVMHPKNVFVHSLCRSFCTRIVLLNIQRHAIYILLFKVGFNYINIFWHPLYLYIYTKNPS